jgi:hypothetical protein
MPEAVNWRTYEEVAADLLNRFAKEFGLDRVEGKQHVGGGRSGTEWEIDAKGIRHSDGGFMIVECRRNTTAKQSQEKLGGLAYRIIDTGAVGGIYVSPLGFQEGAERVAAAEGIFEVTLNQDSTPTDFVMGFLNKFMVGVSTTFFIKSEVQVELIKGPPDKSDA